MVFSDNSTKEENLIILPLKGKMRGEDLYHAFKEYASNINLPLQKLVSITTDDAPVMVGSRSGSVGLCRKDDSVPASIAYHCITKKLCARKWSNFKHVMNMVTIIISSIHSVSLKDRLFKAVLEGVASKYSELILHTEGHWLSMGKVVSRFLELIPQNHKFLESKN
jgi:hypothetical protein